MPELAEVKLMSDFVNNFKGPYFKTFKSSVTKIDTVDLNSPGVLIGAKSRGKELILDFVTKDKHVSYLFTMGMTGNWKIFESSDLIEKHAHFNVELTDGRVLSMVDSRRFARWKIQSDFSTNRSPDPTESIYKKFISKHIGCKHFDKLVYEVMMDQRYFNGVGNYLRAEVLYRLDINPFQSLNDVLRKYEEKFVEMCKLVPLEAYKVGGGEFQSFKNPNSSQEMNGGGWMQCYGKKNMTKMLDSKNRNFWFDPKWKKFLDKQNGA